MIAPSLAATERGRQMSEQMTVPLAGTTPPREHLELLETIQPATSVRLLSRAQLIEVLASWVQGHGLPQGYGSRCTAMETSPSEV